MPTAAFSASSLPSPRSARMTHPRHLSRAVPLIPGDNRCAPPSMPGSQPSARNVSRPSPASSQLCGTGSAHTTMSWLTPMSFVTRVTADPAWTGLAWMDCAMLSAMPPSTWSRYSVQTVWPANTPTRSYCWKSSGGSDARWSSCTIPSPTIRMISFCCKFKEPLPSMSVLCWPNGSGAASSRRRVTVISSAPRHPTGIATSRDAGLCRLGSSLMRRRLIWCGNSMRGWSKTHAPSDNASSASMPGRGSHDRGGRNGRPRWFITC